MSTFDQVLDDDLPQPEEQAVAEDWGWMSPGAHSWSPAIVAILFVLAVLAVVVLR